MTRSWIENAIRVFEDEESVVLVHMQFDRDNQGSYQAHVKAEVGPDHLVKTYDWIIKDRPARNVSQSMTHTIEGLGVIGTFQ